jgi:ABC-type sugar transport system substrate-binding protein
MPRRPVVRPHPLSAQYRTLNAVSAAVATQVNQTVELLKQDPDIVALDAGDAPLSDPIIQSQRAVVDNNLDVYNGGGA